jgi:hypothetical protein
MAMLEQFAGRARRRLLEGFARPETLDFLRGARQVDLVVDVVNPGERYEMVLTDDVAGKLDVSTVDMVDHPEGLVVQADDVHVFLDVGGVDHGGLQASALQNPFRSKRGEFRQGNALL